MSGFARRQFASLASDPVLRTYGALIALIHPLTAWAWFDSKVGPPVPQALEPGSLAICWPFFPSCGAHRPFEAGTWKALVVTYGLLGVVCSLLWARRKFLAWPLHLVLEIAKVAVVLQDYRLRLNEHYMAIFTAGAFLLLPFAAPSGSAAPSPTQGRRDVLRLLIVVFYVWAGLLKLTPDWLTGAALPHLPLGIPESLSPAACKYVVVLELVLVWGLLARSPLAFWSTLIQLVLFHVTSFSVVGYFYPVLMALLLSVFVLARRAEREESLVGSSVMRRMVQGRVPRSGYAYVGLFSALQLIPHFYPGDPAMTGEGRWMALHMFDARMLCRAALRVHQHDGSTRNEGIALQEAVRIHCDPLVVWSRAREKCEKLKADPSFDSFDLVLDSRHASETQYRRVIDQPRFCPDVPDYRALGHNPWIHLDPT